MLVGLSYRDESPRYDNYASALLMAADRCGEILEPVWLASNTSAVDPNVLNRIDGLILTGGGDVEPARYRFDDVRGVCKVTPGRDEIELRILERALARRIPLLAICRGIQLLNVHLGGTLVADLPAHPPHRLGDEERHPITIAKQSFLSRLVEANSGMVNSSHHQAIARLADGLREVAHDPSGVVEAIEWAEPMRRPWLVGVQWHPERMHFDEELGAEPFCGFLDALRASARGAAV